MRLLVLNYEFPPLGGGAAPVSYELAKRYVKAGHEVDAVTMGFFGLPEREKKEGINIYRLRCLRSRKEICRPHEMLSFNIAAMRFFRKHKREYDACHAHFLIPTGLVAHRLKRRTKLKYIVTAHGSDVPGYNTDRFRLLHHFTKPMLRSVCQEASKIVSPSDYLLGLMKKNIGEYDMVKIPNGIDPKQFSPKKKKKTIVATGRLLPRKGFQHLIAAVHGMKTEYEVHILGDGPMMAELKAMAEGSRTRIVFHGWVDNKSQEYRKMLAEASIYCLPSLRENASISLLEAMSSGCAVITTNTTGCAETVSQSGILTEPSAPAIKHNLMKLISKPALITKYGKLARERIKKEYDWDIISKKYLALL